MSYRKLWNTEAEAVSFGQWCEKERSSLIRKQLGFVIRNCKFYQDKYRKAGFGEKDILSKGFELWRLPFTEKSEVIEDQLAHPPFGDLLAVSIDAVARVHRTSGFSGKPVLIALTSNDISSTVEAGARMFWCAGVRPDDIVVHCLNYCLWIGGLTDHLSLERTGAAVIPYGVGNSKNLIELIRQVRPSAISCTPSYLIRLEEILRDDFGLKPRDLNIKKGIFGGEAGLQNPDIRKNIEDKWGMKAIDGNFGVSDVLSAFGSECGLREGLHFHGAGIIHVELIDPHSGKPIEFKKGQVGEFVYTNLTREAQPLVRFRSHDTVEIISTKRCRCGRGGFRFRVIGRSDDMVTVKGINVFPSAIKGILVGFPGVFTGEFEIHLDGPPPYEHLDLTVEHNFGIADNIIGQMKVLLCKKIHESLTCSARIKLVPQGAIARTEGKARRIVRGGSFNPII